MKTISISEFETLVARDDWQREQDHEIVDRHEFQDQKRHKENDSLEFIDVVHVCGLANKTSTLDGIKIIYTESFNYDEYEPDSFSSGTEGQDEVWRVEGVVVVDEDGDKLNSHELADYLNSDFSSIDYSVLEIEQVTDIDVDEDSVMETFIVELDNAPDLLFTGERVASAASSENSGMGRRYSGQSGRWTELSLYKTKGGKFVCHEIGRTLWQGERDRFSGKVCETEEEVKEFFGYRWLAKELYSKARIDGLVEVE